MKLRREQLRLYAVTDRAWLPGIGKWRGATPGADIEELRGAAPGAGIEELCGATPGADIEELCGAALAAQVELALRGGVTMVQLREKGLPEEAFEREARAILRLCRSYGVPLIINDNAELAGRIGADGVHVGQKDMDPRAARALLGDGKIVGVTAKTVEQARAAEAAGADYLGSGAVFGTSTKRDAIPMELDLFEEICRSVAIPVVAIGGITLDNIDRLAGRGMSGFSIVSGIFAAADVEGTARALRGKAERLCGGAADDADPLEGVADNAGAPVSAAVPCDAALPGDIPDDAKIALYCEKIRERRPVVQCITNIVTVNDCANALLAIGASPTMAHHPDEMEDFASISDALVLNMGATESFEAMFRAGRCLNSCARDGDVDGNDADGRDADGGDMNGGDVDGGDADGCYADRADRNPSSGAAGSGHPIVIDPVGCAGSSFRRRKCLELIEAVRPSCIRGNAAEIRALALDVNTGRGVDDTVGGGGLAESVGADCPGNSSPAESVEADDSASGGPAESVGADDSASGGLAESVGADGPGNSSPAESVGADGPGNSGPPKFLKTDSPAKYAALLSEKTGAIVVASGAVDYIARGNRVIELHGGSPMLARITGTGCMLSAMLGAFLSVENSLESAAACCGMMARCGEIAEALARADCAAAGVQAYEGRAAAGAQSYADRAAAGVQSYAGCAAAGAPRRTDRVGAGTFHIRLLDALSTSF